MKTIRRIMVGLFMCFLVFHGTSLTHAEEEIEIKFSVRLISYNYDARAPKHSKVLADRVSSGDWYEINDVSAIETIVQRADNYYNSWLRIEIAPGGKKCEIVNAEIFRTDETPIEILFSPESLLFEEHRDDPEYMLASLVCDVDILNKTEEELTELVQEACLYAVVFFKENGRDEIRQATIPVDSSGAVHNSFAPDDGFTIQLNYCDVYPWNMAENHAREMNFKGLTPVPAWIDMSEAADEYFLCVYRGIKQKNMPFPVYGVEFLVESENAWIGENNSLMYSYSPVSSNLNCDNMYENGSAYIEIRVILRFDGNVQSREQLGLFEEKLRRMDITALYSTEGYGYFNEEDGSQVCGPQNTIDVIIKEDMFTNMFSLPRGEGKVEI